MCVCYLYTYHREIEMMVILGCKSGWSLCMLYKYEFVCVCVKGLYYVENCGKLSASNWL